MNRIYNSNNRFKLMNLSENNIELLYYKDINPNNIESLYLKWVNDIDIIKTIASPELFLPKDKSFIEKSFKRFTSQNAIGFFIRYKGTFIGTSKIDKIDSYHSSAEIGIMIGEKEYWGKGIATTVFRLLTNYCFEVLNLHRVWGGCISVNSGMKNVFLKLGFTQEACLRNAININHPKEKTKKFVDSLLFSKLKK